VNWLQKLVGGAAPGETPNSIESESRSWVLRCKCGHETSVWDMGGIRWKACGRPYRLCRCGRCRKLVWGRLYRKRLDVDGPPVMRAGE